MTSQQTIQIAVRIKPSSVITPQLLSWSGHSIQIAGQSCYSFDHILPPSLCQSQIFQRIGLPLISNILNGYNGCIFAYGQTGSGKTYTMTGDQQQQGLIQRCLGMIWGCIDGGEFREVKMAYFEIYNETVRDLLGDHKDTLNVRENVKSGFYVEGLTQCVISEYHDFNRLIQKGITSRITGFTKMNAKSSRSHSVLDISLSYQTKQRGLNVTRNAKLTFIDLAGSEKQKQTAVQGQRLKQASNINKSLSTLGLVITKLSQNCQKKPVSSHIPYRNSVLTKILKSSLSGRSKIIIICTITTDQKFIDQTISTLRFAQTAKNIKLKVKKNDQQIDGDKEKMVIQLNKIKQMYQQMQMKYQEERKQCEEFRVSNAKLKDLVEERDEEISFLQINKQCKKLQSQQIVYQKVMSQRVLSQFPSSQFFISPLQQNLLQSQVPHEKHSKMIIETSQKIQNYSQLSPSTGNFVIYQTDQKYQQDYSSIKNKFQKKLLQFKVTNQKYTIQNQFLKFQKQIYQHEIASLLKKLVLFQQTQPQLADYLGQIQNLCRKQKFTQAQKILLKTFITHIKRYDQELELATQTNKKQKQQFKLIIQKVKRLLLTKASNINSEAGQQFEMNQNLASLHFDSQYKCQQPQQSSFIKRIIPQSSPVAQYVAPKHSNLILTQIFPTQLAISQPSQHFSRLTKSNQLQLLKKQNQKLKYQKKQLYQEGERNRIRLIQVTNRIRDIKQIEEQKDHLIRHYQEQLQELTITKQQYYQLFKCNQDYLNQMQQLKDQNSSLVDHLKSTRENQQYQTTQLKLKLKQLTISLTNKTTQLMQKKTIIHKKEQQIAKLSGQINQEKERIEQLIEQNTRIKQKIQQLSFKNKEIEQKNICLQKQVKQQKQNLAEQSEQKTERSYQTCYKQFQFKKIATKTESIKQILQETQQQQFRKKQKYNQYLESIDCLESSSSQRSPHRSSYFKSLQTRRNQLFHHQFQMHDIHERTEDMLISQVNQQLSSIRDNQQSKCFQTETMTVTSPFPGWLIQNQPNQRIQQAKPTSETQTATIYNEKLKIKKPIQKTGSYSQYICEKSVKQSFLSK